MRALNKHTLAIGASGTLLLTFLSYVLNNWANAPEELRFVYNALDTVQRPALFAGFLTSGNGHIPNVFTVYLVLFVTYLLLVGCVTLLVNLLLPRKQGNLTTRSRADAQ